MLTRWLLAGILVQAAYGLACGDAPLPAGPSGPIIGNSSDGGAGGVERPGPGGLGGTGGVEGPGSGGIGGAAGGTETGELVRCPRGTGCKCTVDCCSLRDAVDSILIDGVFVCPPGTTVWQGCDPSACPCDTAIRDEDACVMNCCRAGDELRSRSCVDGAWVCEWPYGTARSTCGPYDECPCETRINWLGEVCDGETIVCDLNDRVFEECPPIACQTCNGAEIPAMENGCTCSCREGAGAVVCERTGD